PFYGARRGRMRRWRRWRRSAGRTRGAGRGGGVKASEIVWELEHRGARLRAEDRLCIDAPKDVVDQALLHQLRAQKPEVLALLRKRGKGEVLPAGVATAPIPPQLGLSNFDLGQARAEFDRHGTQPAWDDLIGAARLERKRAWCEETLDAVYRGQLTLWLHPSGRVVPSPRGSLS